ncbi:hypothetical protein P421_16585 [Heyndrickxia coagulans P38]|nr:hypothetical protein P421_16585 [Heyndrickxia coagulans P38]
MVKSKHRQVIYEGTGRYFAKNKRGSCLVYEFTKNLPENERRSILFRKPGAVQVPDNREFIDKGEIK